MTDAPDQSPGRQSPPGGARARIALVSIAAVVALVAIVAILGYTIAPGMVRRGIVQGLSAVLRRPPELDRVRVNPFLLDVKLEGLRARGADGAPVVALQALEVRFDPLRSVFSRAWVFDDVRLSRPEAHLVLRHDGSLDLADLLKPVPAAPRDTSPPPVVTFLRFAVDSGAVTWRDETRSPAYEAVVRPLELLLTDFTTRRDASNSYFFEASSTPVRSVRWRGRFTIAPLASDGRLELAGISLVQLGRLLGPALPCELRSGELAVAGHVHFDARGQAFDLAHDSLSAGARDVAVADRGGDSTLIAVRSADLAGGRWSLADNALSLATLKVDGADVRVPMLANGHLLYEAWAAPETAAAAGSAFVLRAADAHVGGSAVTFEDRRVSPAARLVFDQLEADARGLTTQPGGAFALSLKARLPGAGQAEITGPLTLQPPAADFKVRASGFALAALEPYVGAAAHVALTHGALDADGRFEMPPPGHGPFARFTGDLGVRDLDVQDARSGEAVLRCHLLRLAGVRDEMMPAMLDVREISATRPFLRATVTARRTLNLADLAVPNDSLPAFMAPDTTQPAAPVTIGVVRVSDGMLNFADRTMRPPFSTGIRSLEGTIRGLSSVNATRAAVDLAGKVDAYSPVTISGVVNPLAESTYVDLAMKFQNIELTTFTPYAGRFMGYPILKGKLSLDLKYLVQGRKLAAENKVLANQLTLGPKVDSPDATHLPIRLAIALLKDKDGNIDLDLPVHGDLDDPKFSIGRIVLKVLLNLITKAVTSPFKLIGALVGGHDEDLGDASFAFGSDSLDAANRARLDQLTKGLSQRPGLQLEIGQGFDAARDSAALAQVALVRRLMRERADEGRPAVAALDSGEYARLVGRVYDATFGALPPLAKLHRGALTPQEAAARSAEIDARQHAMENRLLASMHVGADEARSLGRRRALAIKSYVLAAGIGEGRLFVVDTPAADSLSAEAVHVHLRLDAP